MLNAHNLYFRHLRRAWQPILRRDGFGAFNAHHLEIREGYTSKQILLRKWGFGVRVQVCHTFNGFEVRYVPFSPQSGTLTHLHVLELSPDPTRHAHYTFQYGSSEREILANADVLVDAYMRFARPFFRF
ncbi:MAG: hypothetical protein HC933_18805 [Pleurocapsa sp. SU_196_0]|nr:hypothetical protein [Pleurocapsa sp. SU_196_0]